MKFKIMVIVAVAMITTAGLAGCSTKNNIDDSYVKIVDIMDGDTNYSIKVNGVNSKKAFLCNEEDKIIGDTKNLTIIQMTSSLLSLPNSDETVNIASDWDESEFREVENQSLLKYVEYLNYLESTGFNLSRQIITDSYVDSYLTNKVYTLRIMYSDSTILMTRLENDELVDIKNLYNIEIIEEDS